MAVVDMDQDGYDDIIHLADAVRLYIDYQPAGGGSFRRVFLGNVNEESAWGLAVGDMDNNGLPDLVTGGRYQGLRTYQSQSGSLGYSFIDHDIPIFLQGINFADINGDGWLDVFACHDDSENVKLLNDGAGSLREATDILYTGGHSGTYGSVWTDYDGDGDVDLYLSKCSVHAPDNPTDPRRINQLFRNNGEGQYEEVAAAAGLAFGEQSWAADFADIDNDGDLDCFVGNHVAFSKLMRNDGDGTFTDITDSSGVREFFNLIQCVFRDFDNDGWVDLLVVGELHHLWRNNGDLTFSQVEGAFPPDTTTIESCAVGDLNRDGFPDVYAGHAQIANFPRADQPDQLFLNVTNDNHFLSVSLRGVLSNRLASGARLELHGPWGIQVREVRSGESYGITHSFTQTFGLGDHERAERLVIKWPSGSKDTISDVVAGQFLIIEEGDSNQGLALAEPPTQTVIKGGLTHLAIRAAAKGTRDLSFSAEGLPSGLSIQAATGLIAGTTDAMTGVYQVSVVVRDGSNEVSESFQYHVVESPTLTTSGILTNDVTIALEANGDAVQADVDLPGSLGKLQVVLELSADLHEWRAAGAPDVVELSDRGRVCWRYADVSRLAPIDQAQCGFARLRFSRIES